MRPKISIIKIVITLATMLVAGCSSTTVYLNTRYLVDSESYALISHLQAAGYSVESNAFEFPDNISQSTLIYSPMIESREAIDGVIDVLVALQWKISSVSPLVSNNHWFTKNSMGLYLVPEGVETQGRRAKQDLVNVYRSRNCDENIELEFLADGSYQIIFEAGSGKAALHGHWAIRSYPYVELKPSTLTPWYYFEIENKIESDKVSVIEIVELMPAENYTDLANCPFVYGQRL